MSALRNSTGRLVYLRHARSSGIRRAHAAPVNRDQDDTAPSTSRSQSNKNNLVDDTNPKQRHSGPSASQPYDPFDRKGKGRARDDGYVFPTAGKDGKPPGPFEVLGIDRNATQAEIKTQYYKLALLLHPDSSHPSSSQSNFATLNKAYTLLSSPSSRQMYQNFGQGWNEGGGGRGGFRFDPNDPMVQEVFRRKRDGAGRRGQGDAGRGAWGAYGMDGKWYDFPEAGVGGEPKYMSHPKFASVLLLMGAILSWVQYHRMEMDLGRRREVLDVNHLDASHALSQAREEARLHGHARREGIRRRINESKALREIEKQEREAEAARLALAEELEADA